MSKDDIFRRTCNYIISVNNKILCTGYSIKSSSFNVLTRVAID